MPSSGALPIALRKRATMPSSPTCSRGAFLKGMPEGFAAMGQLDMADAVNQNVRGAADWLANQGMSTAVAGFCMGGALAISAGLRVPNLKAAVCFYGIPEDVDPAALKIPFISHFARNDNWCTPGKVDELEARLKAGNVAYELYRYDEGHAFMNTEGPTYSEPSDRLGLGPNTYSYNVTWAFSAIQRPSIADTSLVAALALPCTLGCRPSVKSVACVSHPVVST